LEKKFIRVPVWNVCLRHRNESDCPSIAGSLLGPIIGGFIEENLGFQPVFFITGALLMIAFILTALLVRHQHPSENVGYQLAPIPINYYNANK